MSVFNSAISVKIGNNKELCMPSGKRHDDRLWNAPTRFPEGVQSFF